MKIESGIAVPKKPIDILKSMNVGDSVFDEGQTMQSSRLYAAARKQPKRSGLKFTARTVDGGVRVWRVE